MSNSVQMSVNEMSRFYSRNKAKTSFLISTVSNSIKAVEINLSKKAMELPGSTKISQRNNMVEDNNRSSQGQGHSKVKL